MPRYLTVKEVAALLKVSPKTIYKKKNLLPGYFNLAGLHYFDEEIFSKSLKELAAKPIKDSRRMGRHNL